MSRHQKFFWILSGEQGLQTLVFLLQMRRMLLEI
uniref:Uncharacterized protein n=1 Tax=Rhizophora mucronata TaxID=61149 RepID=A0A2P2IIV4_RHIMU